MRPGPPPPPPPPFPSARRAQLAAVLAADTGLGLQQWELKMFLNEFDQSEDRVTADAFTGIYTYLASRPPTPAAAAPRVSAGAPAAIPAAIPAAPDAAPTITSFPPDYLLDPTGCVPIESVAADVAPSDDAVPSRWRSASGAGQYPKLPFLGGAGAPFSLLVKGTRAMDHLPPPVDVVRRLHVRPSADAFSPHPNDVGGVLAAFAELARKEIGAGSDSGSSRCEMSSYFDLQMLYGTSAEECAAIRTFEGGKIKPDAAARRGGCDSAAAAALLVVFSRNHNLVADHVASAGDGSDEDVFQTARHVNALAFRAVYLKDYVPFAAAGQHLPEPMPTPRADPTRPAGANGSVELDLVLRVALAMEPEPGLAPAPTEDDDVLDVDAALREASAARCGLAARCNVPTRLGASEIAVIRASRAAGVCTLNEFRARCGLPRWTSFEEMTGGETKLCETLAELYRDVDEVELYTGMLCEYNVSNTGAMLPHTAHMCALPLEALANDAWFSEEKLADEGTYTAWGIKHGKETSLASLLAAHTGAKLVGDSPFEVGALAA